MKPLRRIPRETAVVAAWVLALGAGAAALAPLQIAVLDPVETFALATLPIVLLFAVGTGLWRSGRYALRRDEAPLLALPDPEEPSAALRAPPRKRLALPWVWMALASGLCYATAATFGGDGGHFWAFLSVSAVAGVLALCAWVDSAVEP